MKEGDEGFPRRSETRSPIQSNLRNKSPSEFWENWEREREVLERERICRFDSHARTPLCLNILALFYSLYPSVYFVIINVFVLFCVFFFYLQLFFWLIQWGNCLCLLLRSKAWLLKLFWCLGTWHLICDVVYIMTKGPHFPGFLDNVKINCMKRFPSHPQFASFGFFCVNLLCESFDLAVIMGEKNDLLSINYA